MTAGTKALDARKARMAAELSSRYRVTPEQASLAAADLIGKMVSVPQVKSHNPTVRTVYTINRAIETARKMTCEGCQMKLPHEFPYLSHHTCR